MRAVQGFTLVELLVALAVMALLAAMTWRGMDMLFASRAFAGEQMERHASTQIVLSQWALDLDQSVVPAATTPMHWDGQVFRATRRISEPAGVAVVAWTVRPVEGQAWLMRWQSAPLATLAQWRQAWAAAQAWGRGLPLEPAVRLMPALRMEVHTWSASAWVQANTAGDEAPEGLRLRLETEQGVLLKDWANPGVGAVSP